MDRRQIAEDIRVEATERGISQKQYSSFGGTTVISANQLISVVFFMSHTVCFVHSMPCLWIHSWDLTMCSSLLLIYPTTARAPPLFRPWMISLASPTVNENLTRTTVRTPPLTTPSSSRIPLALPPMLLGSNGSPTTGHPPPHPRSRVP